MNLTIYIDVLFLLNMTVDYTVLSSCAVISGREAVKPRIITAAACGALYSVIIFFPRLELLNIVIFKLAASAAIVLIAFRFTNIYSFLKILLTYYITNAVYGGGMYAFYRFTALGSKMNESNGVYYIDLPLWAVIALTFAFYFLIKLFTKLNESRAAKSRIEKVCIHFLNTRITVSALLDTGNSLYDPISLMPVMLVEADAFKGKLSEYMLKEAEKSSADKLPEMHELYPELKLRVVPFKDITGKKRFVYAFKPQKTQHVQTNREIPRLLVGLAGTKLSADGSFNALLHSKL